MFARTFDEILPRSVDERARDDFQSLFKGPLIRMLLGDPRLPGHGSKQGIAPLKLFQGIGGHDK